MASDLRRGQAGGTATFQRHGRAHMSAIGRLGGRPTWQETLRKARQREEEACQRARGRG